MHGALGGTQPKAQCVEADPALCREVGLGQHVDDREQSAGPHGGAQSVQECTVAFLVEEVADVGEQHYVVRRRGQRAGEHVGRQVGEAFSEIGRLNRAPCRRDDSGKVKRRNADCG